MNPIYFEGYDITLKPPRDWDEAKYGPCTSLPIQSRSGVSLSVWKPSLRERLAVLFGAKIALHIVSGQGHPPVGLSLTRTREVKK